MLASAMFALFAHAGHAAPIEGAILLNGGLFTDTNDLEQATEIYFRDATVLYSSGDFLNEGVGQGDAVTFITDPLHTNEALPTNLWSVGGFIFELMTLDIEEQTENELTIFGQGMISFTGQGSDLDPVAGEWRMTTQTPGLAFTDQQTRFSFSSSATVPEPSSLALIALGLAGVAVGRTRRE